MNNRDYGWVTLPGILILAIAPLVGLEYIPAALIAVLVTWPVAMFSLWLMRRLMVRHPRGAAVGLLATTVLRMTVAVGGGALAFFGMSWEPKVGLALWALIAVAYLSTLAAEAFALAKAGWVGRGSVGRKG